jgi:hypothetical protein
MLTVAAGGELQLSDVTLSGGSVQASDENCPYGDCYKLDPTGGGALFNAAGATTGLTRVELKDNDAMVGGAVSSAGTLTLADVHFHHDDAPFGGGLFVRAGSVDVQRASFHDLGRQTYGGGAVFLYHGTIDLRDSTVADNGSGLVPGGGIENWGGTLNLVNDTFAGNVGGSLMTDLGGKTTAENTIIAAGPAADQDSACVGVGEFTGSDNTSDRAITLSYGHNLDQDGHCPLPAASDRVAVDPKLAPLADNGGLTPTEALLHDSPAMDAADGTVCSATDQIGNPRSSVACDIGAFEAVKHGLPTATTEPATDVGEHGATLHATLDLAGEAGGGHFLFGTSQNALKPTDEVAAGGANAVSFALTGLDPNTTYYFQAVADNASGAGSGEIRTFTTAAAPPTVSGVQVESVDDTTAKIGFTIDTGGAPTSYVISYNDGGATHTTPSVSVGTASGHHEATLTGLDPDSRYSYTVTATNSGAPDGVSSPEEFFNTQEQQQAVAGAPFAFTDSGDAAGCPTATTVDWGDGTPTTDADVQCTPTGEGGQDFQVSATHTYASEGHYLIHVTYGQFGEDFVWAQVGPPRRALSVAIAGSGSGSVTGTGGIRCPDTCSAALAQGTAVSLVAHPAAGSVFTGWSGDCTGKDACTPTLDTDRTVTATFALAPPAISGISVGEITDTAADVSFTLDPGGADARYSVAYGPTSGYGASSAEQTVAAASAAQPHTVHLTGLTPGTTYHFSVVAKSAIAPDGVNGGGTFGTVPRLNGSVGSPLALHDSVDGSNCPTATVDWGDGGQLEPGVVSCGRGAPYQLSASHVYKAAGEYQIVIDYGSSQVMRYALIGPEEHRALTVSTSGAAGSVTGTGISCPGTCTATYLRATKVTLTAHPAQGVRFKGWGGACGGTDPSCVLTLDQDLQANAVFEAVPLATTPQVQTPTPTPTIAPTQPQTLAATFHQTVVATPLSGRLLVRPKGAKASQPLTSPLAVALGSLLDTTHGRLTVTSLPSPEAPSQSAVVKGGAFRIGQPGGVTELTLPACGSHVKAPRLTVDARGAFRTRGRYATATTTGARRTTWTVRDTCTRTLVTVTRGEVTVSDSARHRRLTVRAGHSYTARARRH